MFLLDQLAEQRIAEAIERGEMDNLAGAGKPLQFDDDSHVPQELRAAYRVLKNAGFVPPEVELRDEIAYAEDLLAAATTGNSRPQAARRLDYLIMRLNAGRRDRVNLRVQECYYQKLQARLGRDV
ncbi:MAG: DnaJ family domain-containing protein [Gammaproteobacteria bacterium]